MLAAARHASGDGIRDRVRAVRERRNRAMRRERHRRSAARGPAGARGRAAGLTRNALGPRASRDIATAAKTHGARPKGNRAPNSVSSVSIVSSDHSRRPRRPLHVNRGSAGAGFALRHARFQEKNRLRRMLRADRDRDHHDRIRAAHRPGAGAREHRGRRLLGDRGGLESRVQHRVRMVGSPPEPTGARLAAAHRACGRFRSRAGRHAGAAIRVVAGRFAVAGVRPRSRPDRLLPRVHVRVQSRLRPCVRAAGIGAARAFGSFAGRPRAAGRDGRGRARQPRREEALRNRSPGRPRPARPPARRAAHPSAPRAPSHPS